MKISCVIFSPCFDLFFLLTSHLLTFPPSAFLLPLLHFSLFFFPILLSSNQPQNKRILVCRTHKGCKRLKHGFISSMRVFLFSGLYFCKSSIRSFSCESSLYRIFSHSCHFFVIRKFLSPSLSLFFCPYRSLPVSINASSSFQVCVRVTLLLLSHIISHTFSLIAIHTFSFYIFQFCLVITMPFLYYCLILNSYPHTIFLIAFFTNPLFQ